MGDPGSQLKWSVCGYPSWGTSWAASPSSGTGLTPAMGPQMITINVTAPNQKNQQYSGEVKLCNDEDSTDYCTVQASMATPKNKAIYPFLFDFLQRFPVFAKLLQIIYN